jgi:hypothetical protein
MFDIRKIQEQVLYQVVKTESDGDTALEIIAGKQEDNPIWVKNTMRRLEKRFDPSTVKKIRMKCQCGYAMDEKLALLNSLMASSASLEEFANQDRAKAAGLFFRDGSLYLQFTFCPCPMLAEVDTLETNAWCQCTTGYSKVLFEQAFGCEVDVELLKSIKMGDSICLMKTIPLGLIRF